MSTCPAGHQSSADDYCDVCGLPIGAPASSAVPPASEPAPAPPAGDVPADSGPESSACPHCQAVNPANALFCEACGYDFTTGTMPRPFTPSSLDLGSPTATEDDPPTSERPAVGGRTPPAADPSAAAPSGAAAPAAAASPAAPAAEQPPAQPIAPPLAEPWVAEVWIDPDWYAEQESSDPLPSAGLPIIVTLKLTSILVGRTSRSRNIHPDIDLTADNGISRRHCQLTTDGSRWWVEDLGSSNGTYVGSAAGGLPTQPLPSGGKREIAPDERVYLGAWSRIVIRRAQPGEV